MPEFGTCNTHVLVGKPLTHYDFAHKRILYRTAERLKDDIDPDVTFETFDGEDMLAYTQGQVVLPDVQIWRSRGIVSDVHIKVPARVPIKLGHQLISLYGEEGDDMFEDIFDLAQLTVPLVFTGTHLAVQNLKLTSAGVVNLSEEAYGSIVHLDGEWNGEWPQVCKGQKRRDTLDLEFLSGAVGSSSERYDPDGFYLVYGLTLPGKEYDTIRERVFAAAQEHALDPFTARQFFDPVLSIRKLTDYGRR